MCIRQGISYRRSWSSKWTRPICHGTFRSHVTTFPLSRSPFAFPGLPATSPSFPLSHFSSSSLADMVPLSSLSRTLTHYAYLLVFLSPTSCTILRPVVAGLSQAFPVFNLSQYDDQALGLIFCTNTKLLRLKPLTTDSFTCKPSDPQADCLTSPEPL